MMKRYLKGFRAILLRCCVSPKEIILPHEVGNGENIEKMIEKLYGFKAKIVVPKQGEKNSFLRWQKERRNFACQ